MTTESPVLNDSPQTARQSASEPAPPFVLPCPRLIAAAASALLLWACYFPLAWGWLAWVALVPFLCLVRSRGSVRSTYFSSWIAGLLFFVPVLQWMRVADYRMYYTWMMLALYCSAYFPVGLWLMRKLDRKTALPLVVTVPVVWVGLEFVRSFLLSGFAWYYLGHTQHDYLAVIQITDLTGVYGVSFLIAMANAWFFEALYRNTGFRALFALPILDAQQPLKNCAWQGAAAALLIVAAFSYGMTRLEQEDFKPGPRLGLLQASLDQRLRNQASAPEGKEEARYKVSATYSELCKRATAQYPLPDVLVWPETSYPGVWLDIVPEAMSAAPPEAVDIAADCRRRLEATASAYAVPHLIGVNAEIIEANLRVEPYNSALFINERGKVKGRYDKIHRVPFGEYVPFLEWFPFMKRFAPYEHDYSIREGKHLTRFPIERKQQAGVPKGEFCFGVLICYEDTDPFLARRYGRQDADGAPVDFLINISNDGWFDGTSEHDEHLALCRFRAIETRRAIARSVNMGISAIIDSNGRVQKPQLSDSEDVRTWIVAEKEGRVPDLEIARWSEYKQTSGVLMATIPIDDRFSLYTVLGDWLPWGCWLVVVGCVVAKRFHWVRA